MKKTLFSLGLVVLIGSVIGTALTTNIFQPASKKNHASSYLTREGKPLALSRHLEKIGQAIAENGGEGGPGGYGRQKLLELAYPGKDIPFQRIVNARSSFMAIQRSTLLRSAGKQKKEEWESVGPS